MQRFRIEVGSEHGLQPKHIVGAIANEAGLESRYIGQIKIFEDFSTVTLPEGMPKELYQHLRQIRVCGQPMLLSPCDEPEKSDRHKSKKSHKSGKDEQKRTKKRSSSPVGD